MPGGDMPGMVPAVVPQPIPMVINVAQASGADGTLRVVLTIVTAVGQAVYFLEPDAAKQLGGTLDRLGGAGNIALANGLNGKPANGRA
jgi:hypothetical protein